MLRRADVPLAPLTSLRVGGPARTLIEADGEAELIEAVTAADDAGEPLLVLGGGSNVVIADDGFAGTVVRPVAGGIDVRDASDCGGVTVRAQAGTGWDELVARSVAEGWRGIEALSGIPGSCGAAPVQNIGAYGQDIGATLASVRTWDRRERAVRTLALADLGLGYRTSILKREPLGATPRWVVLSIELQLRLGSHSMPVRYSQLAAELDIPLGATAPAQEVRAAVLRLRRGKGMVLDPQDHDTWSAGSFFTNPLLTPEQAAALPPQAPRFDETAPDGAPRVKTSAAWLISHAGVERGWGLAPRATVSTKHSLALTNRGDATASDIVALAAAVRDRVEAAFGIVLEPEPTLIGLNLPGPAHLSRATGSAQIRSES